MRLATRILRILAVIALSPLAGCAWFQPRPPEYEWRSLGEGLRVRDQVVPEGGPEVHEGDTVALHYELRIGQTTIESSLERGMPILFEVGAASVPAGLERAIAGMRLYGKRRVVVPPERAYGSAGRPPLIPPDATLVFDVQVMEIHPGRRPSVDS